MTKEQLKQARQQLGLTQAAMAKAMGIGTRKLERWEGGHSPISAEGATLLRLLVDIGDKIVTCQKCGISCIDGSEEAEFIGWHGRCAQCELDGGDE